MKFSRIALIISGALLFLAACGGSESSIQTSTSAADSSPQATLPPKGMFKGDAIDQPCWWGGADCPRKAIGPAGGIVFFSKLRPIDKMQIIEMSKQTLAPDKLCDSATPRAEFYLWPQYDGIGNSAIATADLWRVCNNGLAGKAYAHSQTSPIYDEDLTTPNVWSRNTYYFLPENCCGGWRLPTLKEAQEIYRLRAEPGGFSWFNCGYPNVCEDFAIEDGWYYTVTPNLEPGKCEYWAINMADGQTKSVKPNEQLRGLMVRDFGSKIEKTDPPPLVPIPERSVLEKYTPAYLQKYYDTQFKGSSASKPATKDGIIDRLLKHPNAVKKVLCSAPTASTFVTPTTTAAVTTTTTTTTTTTVAPTTTVKIAAPPTTLKRVAPTTTVKKVVKKK